MLIRPLIRVQWHDINDKTEQYVYSSQSNAGDKHLCTILCHNLLYGELWLVGVCPYITH